MPKRVAEFLRSVMPADPFQLLFLAGVACLVVAHGLRWWPGIGPFAALGVLPIVFAGAAGYFICFWPGNHPVRRILGLVFLPAMAGLGLMFGGFAYLSGPSLSVLESTGSVVVHRIHWAQLMLGKLPLGAQFSLTGLLLIAIFTSRLAFGIATLPLTLSGCHALQARDSESWRRLQFLIWFLVGIAFLPAVLLSFLTIGVPFLLTSRLPSFVQSDLFPRLSVIPETIIVLGIALAIMGREGREAVWNSIRLPDLRWPLLALVFPIGIDLFISTGQYILDRVQWAASDFGKFAPPPFGSYFNVPDIWLLLLFFAALFEEVIFRGLLQTRFIHRYGLFRGIFLVESCGQLFIFSQIFLFCAPLIKECSLS